MLYLNDATRIKLGASVNKHFQSETIKREVLNVTHNIRFSKLASHFDLSIWSASYLLGIYALEMALYVGSLPECGLFALM